MSVPTGSLDAHAAPGGGATRRILRAAATSGVAAVVAAMAGLVRVKLYAVFLGAAGVGVISQLQSLQNTLAVLGMVGIGIGVSRDVARARGAGDRAAVRSVLSTGRALTGGAALVLVAGVWVFARPLSQVLFGEPGYGWLLRLAAPALVFNTLTRLLSEVLNGHREYGVNARFTLASSGVAVSVLVPMLIILGLAGAVAALPAAALVSWGMMVMMFRRRHPELAGAGIRYHHETGRILLGIGAASLVMATADQLALLVIRARLIQLHGVEANGWFQGVWGLSQYILGVAIAFQSTYAFARVNETRSRDEMIAETNRTLRVTLLMMAPMTAVMILLREPLVHAFLSPEFRPSLPLFAPQAAGSLLRAAGLAVGIGVLAVAPVRVWLALGLSGSVSFLAAYAFLSRDGSVIAVPVAYAISGAVYLAAAWWVMRSFGRLRLERRVAALAAVSAGLLGGTFVVADGRPTSYLWGGLLLAAWAAVAVTPGEARKGIAALVGRLRRGR